MINDFRHQKNNSYYAIDIEPNSNNSWISKPTPVVKWAGGKRQLLNELRSKYPDKLKKGLVKTYLEPFCGGGAVFFDIYSSYKIEKAYLFDKNIELIILYKVIQYDVYKLIDKLYELGEKYLNLSLDERSEFYYKTRKLYNTFDKKINSNTYSPKWIERASYTIFLNKTCFNGLYRVNRKEEFNVPIGAYKNPKILCENNLIAANKAFKIAEIKHDDFSKVLEYANESTFIYYDPPYRPISRKNNFRSYTSLRFDDNEQQRLQQVFVKASQLKALQMLSNSDPKNYTDDTFFDELYKEFNISRFLALRMINSKSSKRGNIKEIIITNY